MMITDKTDWAKLLSKASEYLEVIRPRVIGEIVGQTVVNNIKLRFANSVDIYGKSLTPNSPLTLSNKGSDKFRPLIDSGKWEGSINYKTKGNVVQVGDNFPYGYVHQKDTVITPKNGEYLFVPSGLGRTIRKNKPGIFSKKGGARLLKLKQVKIPARKVYPEIELTQKDIQEIQSTIFDNIERVTKGG